MQAATDLIVEDVALSEAPPVAPPPIADDEHEGPKHEPFRPYASSWPLIVGGKAKLRFDETGEIILFWFGGEFRNDDIKAAAKTFIMTGYKEAHHIEYWQVDGCPDRLRATFQIDRKHADFRLSKYDEVQE